MEFVLFAKPWWVNLLILIPIALFFYWRKNKLSLTASSLLFVGIFAIAFGFVEAAVVVYLRAAINILPGYEGTLSDIARASAELYQQNVDLDKFPQSLLIIELLREAATIIMLAAIALVTTKPVKERFAVFLWAFAIWDIFYYISLYATIRWPPSLLSGDTLFLIPSPWISQVWYPVLVSTLAVLAIAFNLKNVRKKK